MYRLDGGTFTNILSFPLNYAKGAAFEDYDTGTGLHGTKWNPWEDNFDNQKAFMQGANWVMIHPQPILANIEFDHEESMVLVFNDRSGHQMGTANYGVSAAANGTTLHTSVAAGDMLRASLVGGVYVLENNATSGGVTTTGAGNNQGPATINGTMNGYTGTGGEYYWGDQALIFGSAVYHKDAVMGGSTFLAGSNKTYVHIVDAFEAWGGGSYLMNNTTGNFDNVYGIYPRTVTEVLFGKANGLGDPEVMCNEAPIEIGNRVWTDTDNDGIQDAGEAPISGVIVELVKSGSVIATATTDANGNYYFSNAIGINTASAIYGITQLMPDMSYTVRIPNVQGGSKQPALGTNNLTLSNIGGAGQPDVRDSDGVLAGNNADVTVNTTDIPTAGANNHTFDFGFAVAMCSISSITATPGICNPANNQYNLTGQVTFSNPPTSGTLTVTVSGGGSQTFTLPQSSPVSYRIAGQIADGASHTVTAAFSADAACTANTTYMAPANCSLPYIACGDIPVIWLVDEDQAAPSLHLWSFNDYNDATNTGTDYGRLTYKDPVTGITTAFATSGAQGDLESMAVNQSTGQAYFVTASKIAGGPSGGQTLFTYNLNDAAANKGNIELTVIGHIQRPNSWAAEVLALYNNHLYLADPVTGNQNNDTSTDILMSVDLGALNPDVMQNTIPTIIGPIQGLGQVNNYVDGMEILPNGTLYTVDGTDDHLYRVSLATGAILEVMDNNIPGGINPLADVETIVWDPVNSKLIGTDNEMQQFVDLTLDGTNGNNIVTSPYIGTPGIYSLVDFEGSAMYVMCCDLTVNSAIPTACDVNGQYTLAVDVTYTNLSGDITINGQSFTPTGVTGRDTFILVLLTANGAVDVDVTAQSVTEVTCSSTLSDAYDAPASCTAACVVTISSAIPSSCNPINNNYSVSGQVTFSNPPTSGTLTVSVSGGGSQVFNAPFTSPTNYSLTGLYSDGASHTVTAIFSADNTCTASQVYTAPVSCAPTCTLSVSCTATPQTNCTPP
ncbi:MAG TPA: SdrD B-like domain-containing protein, partial [Saprospiraceae bacterium]|nr:SdrD B-like domain-containing protein [Saprospiraceae bacterium]